MAICRTWESCQVPRYLPKGYVIDHNRTLLGHGEAVFIKARAALRAWRMFAIDWVDPFLYPAVLAENTAVAILARLTLPFPLTLPLSPPSVWSLNAARIIYILEQSGPVERYGFAYGTLPDTPNKGRNAFPSNGIVATIPFGTTFWLFPGPIRRWPDSAIHWPVACSAALPPPRWRPCGKRFYNRIQSLY